MSFQINEMTHTRIEKMLLKEIVVGSICCTFSIEFTGRVSDFPLAFFLYVNAAYLHVSLSFWGFIYSIIFH